MARLDTGEFDEFFRTSGPRLLGQAYLLTADRTKAQDLTQEAFLRAWKRWKTVRTYDSPEAWTARVLRNLCISDWRSTSRRAATGAQPGTAWPVPAPDEDHVVLVSVLRSLPSDQAHALVLHDAIGMTVPEISAELDVPEGTVKSWISRGRSRAAAALASTRETQEEGRR